MQVCRVTAVHSMARSTLLKAEGSWEGGGSIAIPAHGPLKLMHLLLFLLVPMPYNNPRHTGFLYSLKLSLLRPDPLCHFHCAKKPLRPQCITVQTLSLS